MECWCKICTNENTKVYRAKNPEKVRKAFLRWKEKNLDRLNEGIRKWHLEHAEQEREGRTIREANRRALKKGSGGTITKTEWIWLKEYYNYTCLCCGRKEPEIKLTLDHVIPLKLGGENVIKNAQPLCGKCNCKKHAKHIDYRPVLME